MSDRPTVALVAAAGTSARAVPLLGLLGQHASVVSWRRRGDAVPDALVLTTVGLLPEVADVEVPFAVWVRHHDEVDVALGAQAAVLLTSTPDLVARGAVLVPKVGLEVDRWPAVPPVVRARWREKLGLPAQHVLHVEAGAEPPGGERALAVASAVVVSGPATLLALALGAPIVTSAETARRLGARPGRDVEVASNAEQARSLAAEIAADDARAASLSWRARRCAEHHLDLGRPAHVVAGRLGLLAASEGPDVIIDLRLEELRTPSSASVRRRAVAAMAWSGADREGSSA